MSEKIGKYFNKIIQELSFPLISTDCINDYQEMVKKMRFATKHLSEEILANLADNLLPKEQLAEIKNHLRACAACSVKAEQIDKIVNLLKADDSQDAPKDSLIWAKNLFRTRFTEPRKSFLQKLVAVLELDLSKNQPAFGERSSSPIRQMLYRADEIGITLRISNDEGKISLMGQILNEKFNGCKIVLENAKKSFFTDANDLSEFKIQDVPDGVYSLTISNDEKEVLVENVELN